MSWWNKVNQLAVSVVMPCIFFAPFCNTCVTFFASLCNFWAVPLCNYIATLCNQKKLLHFVIVLPGFVIMQLWCFTRFLIHERQFRWHMQSVFYIFFHVKSENIKSLHVINIWDWFIYSTRHKWQKVDSFFWICRFSSKLGYQSHQEQLCNFLFLIRTLVKASNDLLCGSL